MTQRRTFNALGTVWWIEADITKTIFDNVLTVAQDFESAYSRFRSGSLLSQLNHEKVLKNPPQEMVKMVAFGLHASRSTQGLFNLTAGAVLSKEGYRAKGAQINARFIRDWVDEVKVTQSEIRISTDMSLDFGGFGKGWLVDKIHDLLRSEGRADVLINGGGDIRKTSKKPIDIPLMLPGDSSKYFAKVSLGSGALATSSPLLRQWGDMNHLIDVDGVPHQGDTVQLTVYSNTAVQADMLATACIVSPDPFKAAHEAGVDILVVDKKGIFEATPGFPLAPL